jgi:hypothetical protein
VHYLEATVNHQNVLEALHRASHLNLLFVKEFCLKFIVKETNYNQIVMSKEFETLEQPLMVEIIRQQQQTPQSRSQVEPQFESTGGYYGVLLFFVCPLVSNKGKVKHYAMKMLGEWVKEKKP